MLIFSVPAQVMEAVLGRNLVVAQMRTPLRSRNGLTRRIAVMKFEHVRSSGRRKLETDVGGKAQTVVARGPSGDERLTGMLSRGNMNTFHRCVPSGL